jgi:transposase
VDLSDARSSRSRGLRPWRSADRVRRSFQDGPLNPKGERLSEQRKYRSWTAKQKLEIVLAGLKGDRSVRDVCREHGISETLYYGWRDKLFEAGREALAGKEERQGERELKKRVRDLERALGRKTYELEIAGEALRGWE